MPANNHNDVSIDDSSSPHNDQANGAPVSSFDSVRSQIDETQTAQNASENREQQADDFFDLTVVLPNEKDIRVMVSSHEQVQDIRQSIIEQPDCLQHTCFHLEHDGERVNDFVELSEVPNVNSGSTLKLVEDPYTEKEARIHFIRIRELIGAAGDRADLLHGINAGLSLYESVRTQDSLESNSKSVPAVNGSTDPLGGYGLEAPASIQTILPPQSRPSPSSIIKSMQLSPWNPPPHQLRSKGHLLYLEVLTKDGNTLQITSDIHGFYVNKSSATKFDPSPKYPRHTKQGAKHSLFTLLQHHIPNFDSKLQQFQQESNAGDLLATCQLSSAIPACPWLVPKWDFSTDHLPDIVRTQESYLISGSEGTETLRDWNEEFQSTKELPKESISDRVFRERLVAKIFADYNEAATRGAMLIAKGEVAPLNPTEGKYAQIFVYNNIFYSFGADGVGTFAIDGGDEAARVATGKDVTGVKTVNQLDIDGLFTPGTVVVDYLGKRIVAQSIVPGIFKQRDPSEHQIDYGGVEGKDIVAEDPAFIEPFKELSKHLRVKRHPVWDKEKVRHDLEGSVETKGLLGTDGRKYVLDLYRTTPLDIDWLEQHWQNREDGQESVDPAKNYPHRMAILRPELVESFWRSKLQQHLSENIDASTSVPPEANGVNGTADHAEAELTENKDDVASQHAESDAKDGDDSGETVTENKQENQEKRNKLIADFEFALNPDVFSGQEPQSEEERLQMAEDEKEVRTACKFLTTDVIPKLIGDLREGEVGFPMDGQSLVGLLHKRGINVRYLGLIAELASTSGQSHPRTEALRSLATQEMITRGFKHLANKNLRDVAAPAAPACLAHLLNCLLGSELNPSPVPEKDDDLKSCYKDADWSFEAITPSSLREDLISQVQMRYRFDLGENANIKQRHLQILREIALKLGLQLEAKDYLFFKPGDDPSVHVNGSTDSLNTEPLTVNGTSGSSKKKNKKGGQGNSPNRSGSPDKRTLTHTFGAEDIQNIVPIIKEASPKSVLADEAMEAGRISIAQDQRTLGNELLLESMSLHEQIYGILHPEVARAYYTLSTLFYVTNKELAADLAKKAVIISERTLGVDSADTILSYLNLSLFAHNNNETTAALKYVRHALDLWKLVYGSLNHPDSVTTINNAAVMLQSQRCYKESRLWFEDSLEICKKMCGENSINTGTLLFQLAQALALDHDAKGAVTKMQAARGIFSKELGPDDRNTKEADQWLGRLVSNAVSISKHLNDLKDNRSRRVTIRAPTARQPPRIGVSAADVTLPGQTVSGRRTNLDDPRDIEKLMKYINGDEGEKKAPKQKNPRTRGPRKTRVTSSTAA
ncbi:MAG: Intracellular distribution of mitochondria [Bathelium mastoideum]|nr:MAG: Intracellular distribution of mitochondria [Bathelium mastoideum]